MVLMVLGIAQDGGFPQPGCFRECCKSAKNNQKKLISSVAVINAKTHDCWLIDITPDFRNQMKLIKDFLSIDSFPNIKGIFLTHAHVGHYLGLLDLGIEIMNTKDVPVYAMPVMRDFLKKNAPFNFLIDSKNIIIKNIEHNQSISLSNAVSVKPFLVPHRNELSETVGYNIKSSNKSITYLPDIDGWELWDKNILDVIVNNDILFLDGTFYSDNEIPYRNISKVPHPFISDSLKVFSKLDSEHKKKIFFTHLNHTNPLLHKNSLEAKSLINEGYNILEEKRVFNL